MCREDSSTPMLVDPSQETPPRAWGRLLLMLVDATILGNTPTCVGKTECEPLTCQLFGKHPHVRGEDHPEKGVHRRDKETPPRAWGRLANHPVSRPDPWKHPHVRGEDLNLLAGNLNTKETPPRAWGRRGYVQHNPCQGGNTPTCVGKTMPYFRHCVVM
ncbi:Domain of uncharacterised function (DUF2825) [Klebsiella pneumoniae]|nr:Domain of uncharacterised function (DUF2825) [Klebsiella pneumoniae]